MFADVCMKQRMKSRPVLRLLSSCDSPLGVFLQGAADLHKQEDVPHERGHKSQ